MASVTVGPVTLNARQIPGSGFFYGSLAEWYDLPDSKAANESIPGGHGNFDGGEDWSDAHPFTIPGFARGVDRLEVTRMKSQLNSVRSLADLTTITVDDDENPTSRDVSIQRIKWSDQRYGHISQFTIDCLAYDPLRYGAPDVQTTGLPVSGGGFAWPAVWPADWGTGGYPGRIVTTNTGSQPGYTQLAVTGGLGGGFSVVNRDDGQEVRLEREIPLGSTAYVDPTTGQAWLDVPENDISGFLTVSDWWAVPAGETRTLQFNGLGTVTGTPTLTGTTSAPNL